MSIHFNLLIQAILLSTHKKHFYAQFMKIIHKISINHALLMPMTAEANSVNPMAIIKRSSSKMYDKLPKFHPLQALVLSLQVYVPI